MRRGKIIRGRSAQRFSDSRVLVVAVPSGHPLAGRKSVPASLLKTETMLLLGTSLVPPIQGVSQGHHDLSHHGNSEEKKAKIAQINRFHTTQLAHLLGKLKSVKEGDGTLLDHTMLVYGSGNSDGNAHNHDNLPLLLAGRGCGTIKPGQHIVYPKETPLNNLWLALLNRMDLKTQQLGDSTGELTRLA